VALLCLEAMSSHEEAAAKAAQELHGTDIAAILKATGPTVKCVLLKHMMKSGKDVHPHLAALHEKEAKSDEESLPGKDHAREVLTELIEEVTVDTTPAKNEVQKLLGAKFTFLGQYASEGTVVMARCPLPDNLQNCSVKELRELCEDNHLDTSNMLEKPEMVSALLEAQPPLNPHKLQPPLHGLAVSGDILIMKVAETDEVLDEEGGEAKEVEPMSNEEFFLDYTKDEYVSFASRTDIVAAATHKKEGVESKGEEHEEEEEEEDKDEGAGGGNEDDEEEDEEFLPMGEEDERRAMLNFVLGGVIKRFREDNERGPNTEELLELRRQVAAKMDMEDLLPKETGEDDRKRSARGDVPPSPKRVKFEAAVAAEAPTENGEDDRKMPATGESTTEDDDKKMPATGEDTRGDA
jgi:hypothetical protein